MSETAKDSCDLERKHMFQRSGFGEESAETPQVFEMSNVADEVEESQRLVDQDSTDLPSCSFSKRVCSLRKKNWVVLGVSSKQRRYLKCIFCSLWLPSDDIEAHYYRSRERSCSRVSTLWPYLQLPLVFLRQNYISHKERMREACDLDHDSEVVDAAGDEFERMPEMDPSSGKPPSLMARLSYESMGENLTFQMVSHLVNQKKQKRAKKSAFKRFGRDIRCSWKFCDVNIPRENINKHFWKFHLLERKLNWPCCPRFVHKGKTLKKHFYWMQSDESDDSVSSVAFQFEDCVSNFPENFFRFSVWTFWLEICVEPALFPECCIAVWFRSE